MDGYRKWLVTAATGFLIVIMASSAVATWKAVALGDDRFIGGAMGGSVMAVIGCVLWVLLRYCDEF